MKAGQRSTAAITTGAVGLQDQPDGQREGGGADDGAHGNVPGPGDHHRQTRPAPQPRPNGCQAEKGAHETGHGLAALEPQEHRVGMAGHHREGRGAHPKRVWLREPAGQPHGEIALWRYRAAASPRRRRGRWCAAHWWRRYCRCRRSGRRRRSSTSPAGIRRESHRSGRRSARTRSGIMLGERKLRKFSVHGTGWAAVGFGRERRRAPAKSPKSSDGSAAMVRAAAADSRRGYP